MEYQAQKEKLNVCSTVFTGCKEQALDIDLSLPDYCPDVRRVLKCRITPQVNSRTINGDVIEIDGSALVSVMYSDEEGCLRCYEHSSPFNAAMSIKNPPDDYIIAVHTKTEYVNCRALTPRRLDLHGSFSVCARVMAKSERELVTCVDGDDIEQRFTSRTCSELRGMGQQTVSITEITPLPQGKMPIQTILRREANISVDETRIVPDKAMVSGSIRMKLFYIGNAATGETDTVEYDIPFSRVIDIAGIDSDCTCLVSAEKGSISVSVSDDDENEIITELKMTLCALCCSTKKVRCVSDAYSTKYDLRTKRSQICLPDSGINVSETLHAKADIDFGDKQVSKITDVWCEVMPAQAECADGRYLVKTKLSINIIACTQDGEQFFTERTCEISGCVSEGECVCDIESELYSGILSYNCRITGDSGAEFTADVKVCGATYRDCISENVVSAEADEDTAKPGSGSGLILYYAESGESLWEIAKRYRTPIKGIIDENELNSDKLDDTTDDTELCAESGLLILPSF